MRTAILAAVGLLLASGMAASASNYAFRLHNSAKGYRINGFYTYQDGVWSDNWLPAGVRINPGEGADMDWFSNKGACVVPFRVSWDNYGADDFQIDWCKHPHNIYMQDKGFTSD